MRIEHHPKALVATLLLGLAAAVGAGHHLIVESRAAYVTPLHGLACSFPMPEAPRPQPAGDSPRIDVAALPAALAEALGTGALSPRSPATLALLVQLDAIVKPEP